MFMFISIQYFTEKLVESYFDTIYNVKNEKMAYFLNFMVFTKPLLSISKHGIIRGLNIIKPMQNFGVNEHPIDDFFQDETELHKYYYSEN